MSRVGVHLVEDAGAAAADEGAFFRTATFLAAEGVTHTLVVGDGDLRMPVVRRPVPQGGYDAVTPYGYPGATVRRPGMDVADVDFSGSGLVSLFVRERLGVPALTGGTPRNRVFLHDPARPRTVRSRVATKVRSNGRLGYRAEPVHGPDVDDDLLKAFVLAYYEAMRRADAASRYYFPVEYLRACLQTPTAWLLVVRGPEDDVAAASINVVSDGYLHYFLGGAADAHHRVSPTKNMIVGMMDLADHLGLPLNLGGGMTPGDSLETFKANFANGEARFHAHGIVTDPAAYQRLVAGGPPTEYFPAYRTA